MITNTITSVASRTRALSTARLATLECDSYAAMPRMDRTFATARPVHLAARIVVAVPSQGFGAADAKPGSPPRGEPR